MVNSILQYIEPQLKAYMQFLNRVDSPVFRISNGEMIKGNGQEKEVVTISDLNGNSLYIRQTQPETINERKALSSCDKEYNISARCKVVFYTFGGNDFTINPDKVKSKIVNTLARLDFSHYTGSSTEIKIDVNGTSLDIEKIYTEETGKEFTGNVWPTLVSVDFTLSYVDTNCNTCDIDDSETVVTWTPDLTPENCETKAICEVISKCDVITLLQEQTASLQEQIDNLPQSGLTCTDLPNCQTIIDILQSINDIISGLPSSYFSCADLEFCQTIIDIVSDISALQTQVGTNTTDISTLQGQVSSLISDLGTLTTTVNNHISDTSNPHNVTLEQARSENSSISGDINANNNTIINLKDAVNPQEPITKIQFDTYVSAVGGNRGAIDCSANPNYPASKKGDRWEVTVAGKIGGASGINVDVYDEIVCVAASASGDQATVGVNFYIVQGNIERATETTNGYTSYATDAETQSGTNNTKTITPLKLYNWFVALVQSVFVKKGTLTTNYIPKATASDTIGDSQIFDDGTNVGIGTTSPTAKLHVVGQQSKFDYTLDGIGTGVPNMTYSTSTGGMLFNIYYPSGGGYMTKYFSNGTVLSKTVEQAGYYTNFVSSRYDVANIADNKLKLSVHMSNGFTAIGNDYFVPNERLEIRDGNLRINDLTASQIVETDASKNLVSAAKGTAYNKDFGTGTTNIPEIGSTLVASEITATDSNGKLQSLNASTYPSLTELSYVKGLTSPVQSQINLKEPSISGSGNTTDFWSGAKTFRNLSTDIRATVLTGLSLVTSQTIAATDTVLQAFGYLQAQITANKNSIDSKTLFKTTTDTSTHTGTLTNTIVFSEDISNKLSSGDIAEIVSDVVRVSGSTSTTIRYYLNSSNSLTGATAIGVYTYGFSGLNIADFRRQLIVKSSTSIRIKGASSSLLNDYGVFSNYTDVSVNLGSLWIIFAITLGNTGDQFLVSSRKMVK